MKKSFIALCATVLALAACQKEEKVVPVLNVSSETEVTVEKDGGIFTVDFVSNVDWTAKIDAASDVAKLDKTSGTAEEQKVKVTVNPLTEDNATRTITLTLTPKDGTAVTVVFTQNGPYVPYFRVSTNELTFGKEGGSQKFTIETNCKNIKVDAPTVGKIEINDAFTEATFTMPASTSWSDISDRVKFTVEEILDPVLDDEGNDTGKTDAHVERVYAYQEGLAKVSFTNSLPADVAADGEYSVAVAGGYILVCDHTNVFAFKSEDGSFVMKVDLKGAKVNCLTTDDAGNIVLAIGGGAFGENFTVMAIPVATMTDASTYKTVFNCVNQFYGYGYFGLQATGDVTKKAVVSVYDGMGWGSLAYGVAWQVNDGTCADEYTKYAALPTGADVWSSHHGAVKFLSNEIAGGVLYIGYDKTEKLYYNPGFEDTGWVEVCDLGISSNEGPLALDVVEYNNHKYAVIGIHSYFSYSATAVAAVNIDDPTKASLVATMSTRGDKEFVGDNNTAVCAEVENGKLAIYTVGQGYRLLSKIVIAE